MGNLFKQGAQNLGNWIYAAKSAIPGLSQVNLFPGDVNRALTGTPAQDVYGGPGSEVLQSQISSGSPIGMQRAKVLGASTGTGTVSGGVSDFGTVDGATPTNNTEGTVDPYAQLRGDISSGWDQYIGSLDQQLYGLGEQMTNQQGIAQSQFNQSSGTLDLQNTQGMQSLGNQETQVNQNQVKNLNDVASNLRNSFQAGNIYLGARGAGDSSAANQYAFAITKLGSRSRGDIMSNTANIMNDIKGRVTNLTNIYNEAKNRLKEGLNQQMLGISQWFANAQQTIQQQKAQGALGKSQDLVSLSKDILNQALSQVQQAQQQATNRQAALDSWATTNSTTLAQLQNNIKEISQPQYQLPQAQALTGSPQMTANNGIYVPSGYGSSTTEKKTLFG